MHTEHTRIEWLKPMDLQLTFANGAGAHSESGSGLQSFSSFNFDAELSTLLRWRELAAGGLVHADAAAAGSSASMTSISVSRGVRR